MARAEWGQVRCLCGNRRAVCLARPPALATSPLDCIQSQPNEHSLHWQLSATKAREQTACGESLLKKEEDGERGWGWKRGREQGREQKREEKRAGEREPCDRMVRDKGRFGIRQQGRNTGGVTESRREKKEIGRAHV